MLMSTEEEASHPSAEELRNAEPLTFALLEVAAVLYFILLLRLPD